MLRKIMFRFKSSLCSVCSGRIYLGLNRLVFRFKSGVVYAQEDYV